MTFVFSGGAGSRPDAKVEYSKVFAAFILDFYGAKNVVCHGCMREPLKWRFEFDSPLATVNKVFRLPYVPADVGLAFVSQLVPRPSPAVMSASGGSRSNFK
jgi:hypothetical protein